MRCSQQWLRRSETMPQQRLSALLQSPLDRELKLVEQNVSRWSCVIFGHLGANMGINWANLGLGNVGKYGQYSVLNSKTFCLTTFLISPSLKKSAPTSDKITKLYSSQKTLPIRSASFWFLVS